MAGHKRPRLLLAPTVEPESPLQEQAQPQEDRRTLYCLGCDMPRPDGESCRTCDGLREMRNPHSQARIDLRNDPKSKYMCGTITRGARIITLTGTEEQVAEILRIFHEMSSSIKGILLTVETHENGEKHYHWLIHFRNSQRPSMLNKARSKFDEWVGSTTSNNITWPMHQGRISKNYQIWMAYICKDFAQGSVLVEEGSLKHKWRSYTEIYHEYQTAP